MKLAVLLATIGLALTIEARAQPLGSLAEISVIDRETGAALSPHYDRGEYWVAGRPGAKYSIEIHNRLGERLLAVTSVDGVNVLSGETAAWDQAGYVFEPGERYQVTGWRKSDAEVAAFTFTESRAVHRHLNLTRGLHPLLRQGCPRYRAQRPPPTRQAHCGKRHNEGMCPRSSASSPPMSTSTPAMQAGVPL